MKNILTSGIALSVVAMTALFSSCKFEQENYFEETAALRIEHTNDNLRKALAEQSTDDKHGWLIQYFCGGTDSYDFEGFNLFGRFYESGKVVLSSNHRYLRDGKAGTFTSATSSYELVREEGCVLAFSTWNDVLSVFVDPVDPSKAPKTIIGDGEGMKGDDRLVLDYFGEDEILFHGERHLAFVRFSKLYCSPEEYLAQVADFKASLKVSDLKIANADTTLYLGSVTSGLFTVCDRLDDPLKSEVGNCCFTPNGMLFGKKICMKSDTVRCVLLNDEKTKLVSGNVEANPCWGRFLDKACQSSGQTVIDTEGACPALASLLESFSSQLTTLFSSQSFSGLTFGKSSEASNNCRTGLVFMCKSSKSSYNTGFQGTVTIDQEASKATIAVDPNDGSSNYTSYAKKGLDSAFVDIVNAMNGSYTLSVDNTFGPSQIKWTKEGDSSFYFVMKVK